MISTRSIPNQAVNAIKLDNNLRKHIYVWKTFNDHPIVNTAANSYGAPTGTGGDLNIAKWPEFQAAIHVKGTQTLLAPLLDTTNGLDISQDQTDNDGVEYAFGGLIGARNPMAVTIGTTPATFARLKIKIADVSGTDDCAFGFRKMEAAQANLDDYDEMAAINVIAGSVKTETILNGGATGTSAELATWADAAAKELKVVLVGRTASFFLDGVKIGTNFTFDSGEVVVPFFFFLQATTSPGKVFMQEFEFGRLTDIDPEGKGV